MHKTSADLHFFCNVCQRTVKSLLCYLMAKSFCCPFIPAASAVCFREWSPTRHTAKSSLVHDKSNAVCTKLTISFHSLACIMDLFTSFSTRRAELALFSRSYLHLDISVRSNALAHDLEFWQIQWHQNSLLWSALSSFLLIYGMLFLHRLSFVRCRFLLLSHQTKDKLIPSFRTLFSYPPAVFTRKDRDPTTHEVLKEIV